MPTREDVALLFNEWKLSPKKCSCPRHDDRTKELCQREKAWREYVKARDQYLAGKEGSIKSDREKIGLAEILFTMEDMQ